MWPEFNSTRRVRVRSAVLGLARRMKAVLIAKEETVRFIVSLDRDETGMVVAECPAIPGCISQGKTEEDALDNIREAIEACLEARAASGMPLTVSTREVEVKF